MTTLGAPKIGCEDSMADEQSEILAWIGAETLAGRVPAGQAELRARLAAAGFAEAAIDAALAAAATAAPDPQATEPLSVLQLSDAATHFLNTLRDLGYLDDLMEDDVLDAVMEEFEARHGTTRGVAPGAVRLPSDLPNVELDDLRRHVATVLFDRQYELTAETVRFLEQEWRVAFH